MALFVDTSALVKLFVREPGSERVDRMTSADPEIYIGPFTHHEFISAVQRRIRDRTLTPAGAGKAIAEFRNGLRESLFVIPFEKDLSHRALLLLEKHGTSGLRTLDALQLSACLGVPEAAFVVSDRTLARIATNERVKTIIV